MSPGVSRARQHMRAAMRSPAAITRKGLLPFPSHAGLGLRLSSFDHLDVRRIAFDRDGVASAFESGHTRRSTSREAVENDIALVGEDLDEPACQQLWLLCRMPGSLGAITADEVAHHVPHAGLREEIECARRLERSAVVDEP